MVFGSCRICGNTYLSLEGHQTTNARCSTALKKAQYTPSLDEVLFQGRGRAPPPRHEFGASAASSALDEHGNYDMDEDVDDYNQGNNHDFVMGEVEDDRDDYYADNDNNDDDEGVVMKPFGGGTVEEEEALLEEGTRSQQRFPVGDEESHLLPHNTTSGRELHLEVQDIPIVLAKYVIVRDVAMGETLHPPPRGDVIDIPLENTLSTGRSVRVTQNTRRYVSLMDKRSVKFFGSATALLASKNIDEYVDSVDFKKALPRPLNMFEEKAMLFAENSGLSASQGEELFSLFREFGVETTKQLSLSSPTTTTTQSSSSSSSASYGCGGQQQSSSYTEEQVQSAIQQLLPRKFKVSRDIIVKEAQMETPSWTRPVEWPSHWHMEDWPSIGGGINEFEVPKCPPHIGLDFYHATAKMLVDPTIMFGWGADHVQLKFSKLTNAQTGERVVNTIMNGMWMEQAVMSLQLDLGAHYEAENDIIVPIIGYTDGISPGFKQDAHIINTMAVLGIFSPELQAKDYAKMRLGFPPSLSGISPDALEAHVAASLSGEQTGADKKTAAKEEIKEFKRQLEVEWWTEFINQINYSWYHGVKMTVLGQGVKNVHFALTFMVADDPQVMRLLGLRESMAFFGCRCCLHPTRTLTPYNVEMHPNRCAKEIVRMLTEVQGIVLQKRLATGTAAARARGGLLPIQTAAQADHSLV